jgi:segregation and condensation protein A
MSNRVDKDSGLQVVDASSRARTRIVDDSGQQTPNPQSPTPNPAVAGGYRVRLDLFEGPLDLLLHLIKKNEVDVSNIPVAAITEQYLSYLDLMRELNLDIAGEYLVMAATLTLVKSRMLLPSAEPDEEEEADPRADLVRRLLEYQRFREAAQSLAERPWLNRDVYVREPSAEGVPTEDDGPARIRVTTWELVEAFRVVLKRAQPDPVHEVQGEPVSLQDRIRSVLQTLSVARSVTFDSLFGDEPTRHFVIVTFLAMLELMKLGAIDAIQEERWGPILIVLSIEDVRSVSIELAEDYEGLGYIAEEQGE